jgi:2-phosphosulfolactate phosphatase
MTRTVVIDCFPECLPRYQDDQALVAVDVIRASTTAVTAVSLGRRCLPAVSIEEAVAIARWLRNPLLVGELGGSLPYGFDLQNSPAAVAARRDLDRPMVLLSTSGTRVMRGGHNGQPVYVACFRNQAALASHLARNHDRVVLVGAGARGEFREEDQLGCARIAERLIEAGYRPLGDTASIVSRWKGVAEEAIRSGASADYLRRTGQERDLDFILEHIDDLQAVVRLNGRRELEPVKETVFAGG